MAISTDAFAAALGSLRPRLIESARRARRCTHDHAEDLVSEVVLIALERLPEYAQKTGSAGLRRWLFGILRHVVRRDYQTERAGILAAPLSEAEGMHSTEYGSGPRSMDDLVRTLPPSQRRLVQDWLEGYSQHDIARRSRLHRNTVDSRLAEAFATLRGEVAGAEVRDVTASLFAYCSRVTVYRKPTAAWRPWSRQHPPERPFRRAPGRGVRRVAPEDK